MNNSYEFELLNKTDFFFFRVYITNKKKMFSSKHSNKIIEFIENKFNKETLLFEEYINNIKNELNQKVSDNRFTDSVIVYSPLLEVSVIKKDEKIKVVVQYINKDTNEPANLSCLSDSVKDILKQAAHEFGIHNPTKYMLKIHGKEEYLPPHLKYIRDCLCLSVNPVFVLVKVKNVNTHLSFYKFISSKISLQLKSDFQFKFDQTNYNLIEKVSLEEILSAIVENNTRIRQAAKEKDKLSFLFFCETFKKNFKELTSRILNIKYTPFLKHNDSMENIEKGIKDNPTAALNFKEVDSLMKILDNYMESCIKFYNCAATFFYWPFKLKEPNLVLSKGHSLTNSKDKIKINVESLSNLSNLMSNLNLELK